MEAGAAQCLLGGSRHAEEAVANGEQMTKLEALVDISIREMRVRSTELVFACLLIGRLRACVFIVAHVMER